VFGLGKKKSEEPVQLEDIEAVWNWCDNLVVEAKDMRRNVEEFRDEVEDGEEKTELDFEGMVRANLEYIYRAVREIQKVCKIPLD